MTNYVEEFNNLLKEQNRYEYLLKSNPTKLRLGNDYTNEEIQEINDEYTNKNIIFRHYTSGIYVNNTLNDDVYSKPSYKSKAFSWNHYNFIRKRFQKAVSQVIYRKRLLDRLSLLRKAVGLEDNNDLSILNNLKSRFNSKTVKYSNHIPIEFPPEPQKKEETEEDNGDDELLNLSEIPIETPIYAKTMKYEIENQPPNMSLIQYDSNIHTLSVLELSINEKKIDSKINVKSTNIGATTSGVNEHVFQYSQYPYDEHSVDWVFRKQPLHFNIKKPRALIYEQYDDNMLNIQLDCKFLSNMKHDFDEFAEENNMISNHELIEKALESLTLEVEETTNNNATVPSLKDVSKFFQLNEQYDSNNNSAQHDNNDNKYNIEEINNHALNYNQYIYQERNKIHSMIF